MTMTSAPSRDRRPVVLATGGTGGHMFPAESLARALLDRGERVILVTDRRGQAFGNALPDVPVYRVRARTPSGGPVQKARAAMDLLMGYGQARGILRALNAAVAVGFGGYPSVPTLFAASRLKVPVVLHEQNAVLGRANRLFARRTTAIATAFPTLQRLNGADPTKIVMTGNPVRAAIAALRDRPFAPPRPDGAVEILVIGGSQGARALSELVPAAIARLPGAMRARLRISQQSRREHLHQTRRALTVAGVTAEVADFFTDVPDRLARAHLVICRAGASTMAELATAGRPAILIPYPHAMDDHQTANASAMVAAGGGWLMAEAQLDADRLSGQIEALIGQPQRLVDAAAGARALASADAAAALADLVLGIAGRNGDSGAPSHPVSWSREAAA